ncbi:hypothetical protein BDP27DRAFT_1366035 [Rhodocollybia butyracea]|uniref:Uncharacterized protein n=1 Tax=Rhodocollybia butyracea TaxID=206335 RepID=A0A9P5PHW4_9AGAR|nr:hypothetical protein BDP27DRAFT_1366035 [Rhodocollybia butyracea]
MDGNPLTAGAVLSLYTVCREAVKLYQKGCTKADVNIFPYRTAILSILRYSNTYASSLPNTYDELSDISLASCPSFRQLAKLSSGITQKHKHFGIWIVLQASFCTFSVEKSTQGVMRWAMVIRNWYPKPTLVQGANSAKYRIIITEMKLILTPYKPPSDDTASAGASMCDLDNDVVYFQRRWRDNGRIIRMCWLSDEDDKGAVWSCPWMETAYRGGDGVDALRVVVEKIPLNLPHNGNTNAVVQLQ